MDATKYPSVSNVFPLQNMCCSFERYFSFLPILAYKYYTVFDEELGMVSAYAFFLSHKC